MTRSDVTLCSWNCPLSSTGNTGLYLSRSVSAEQSGLKPDWESGDWCRMCTFYKTIYQPH